MASPSRAVCPHHRAASTCSECLTLQTGTGFTEDIPRASYSVFRADPALEIFNTQSNPDGYRSPAPTTTSSGARQAETPRSAAPDQGRFTNEDWYRMIAGNGLVGLVNSHNFGPAHARQSPTVASRPGSSATVTHARVSSSGRQVNGVRQTDRSATSTRGTVNGQQQRAETVTNGHDGQDDDDDDDDTESSDEDESEEDEEREEQSRRR